MPYMPWLWEGGKIAWIMKNSFYSCHLPSLNHYIQSTVYVVIFTVVLFSRNSWVVLAKISTSIYTAIYSNVNITKITNLSHREFPHLVQNRKSICTQNIWPIQHFTYWYRILHTDAAKKMLRNIFLWVVVCRHEN